MPDWIKDHPQYEVISAALRSESLRQQQWAKEVLGQLDTQQTQYAAEHDDLCWYFLTFCVLWWGFNKEYTAKSPSDTKAGGGTWVDGKKPYPHPAVPFPSDDGACIDIDMSVNITQPMCDGLIRQGCIGRYRSVKP